MVRLAGDDVEGQDRSAAESRLVACGACREIHDDVRSLRRSLAHDLPTPVRPDDFRLSAVRRDRLADRPTPSGQPGWLGRLFGARPSYGTSLAGAAVVLGLILLVAGGTFGGRLQVGGALEPIGYDLGSGAGEKASPAAAPTEAPRAATSLSSATAATTSALGAVIVPSPSPMSSTSATRSAPTSVRSTAGAVSGSARTNGVALAGGLLVVLGLLTLVARRLARRRPRAA